MGAVDLALALVMQDPCQARAQSIAPARIASFGDNRV
jgi:hypothetical protein